MHNRTFYLERHVTASFLVHISLKKTEFPGLTESVFYRLRLNAEEPCLPFGHTSERYFVTVDNLVERIHAAGSCRIFNTVLRWSVSLLLEFHLGFIMGGRKTDW